MPLLLGITGLPGSGKSIAARILEKEGFRRVHFGDIIFEELSRRGLPKNETNERSVREELRSALGLGALALLWTEKLRNLLKESNHVVIDGVYSWEEVSVLKENFLGQFYLLALHCSPLIRYSRLSARKERALDAHSALSRDLHELDTLHKGPTLALADLHIVNEKTVSALKRQMIKGLMQWRKDQDGTSTF